MTDDTMTARIQLHRTRGWKMPPNTVKVDRSTVWGNPFVIGQTGPMQRMTVDAASACGHFEAMIVDAELRAAANYPSDFSALRGKHLACWCALDQPCHGDVLVRVANQ